MTIKALTDNDYYSNQKALSYNQYITMVIGARSIGKTFDFKRWLLKRFINHGEQFIYLRRTQTELDEIDKDNFFKYDLIEKVFDDITEYEMNTTKVGTEIKFYSGSKHYKITISSKRILINNKVACYMKPLNAGVKLKGSEYDEVKYLLFDEVLIDKSQSQNINYLPNEMNSFFQFIFSVFRLRSDVRIFLLSNATDVNNPYYNYLGFDGSQEKEFVNFKKRRFLIQFPRENPKDLVEENHPYFDLIEGSEVEASIVENAYQSKYSDNVKKLQGYKSRIFTIYDNGQYITIYDVEGVPYVKFGFDKNLESYTFNLDSIGENIIYVNRSSPIAKLIRKYYYNNEFVYDTINVRNSFNNMIRRII